MRNSKNMESKPSEEVINNRKKGSKKVVIILITAIVLCAIIAGAIIGLNTKTNPSATKDSYNLKVFSVAEMLITLSDDFKSEKVDGFTACFNNKNIDISTLKETFSSKDELQVKTIEEYAEIVIKNNDQNPKILKQKNNLTYFEYSNKNKYYFTALYKTNEAFWTVTFSCKDKNQEEYKETFVDFAKDIKFTN